MLPLVSRQRELNRDNDRGKAQPIAPGLGDMYAMLAGLPGVRGAWVMTGTGGEGLVPDITGRGKSLTVNNSSATGVHDDLIPYMNFDGVNQSLSRADETPFDITGALTLGGWFWRDTAAAAAYLFGKYNTAGNQRAYNLIGSATTPTVTFVVSSDGTSGGNATVVSTNTTPLGEWAFVVGRYTPSTELKLWVNGVATINTTSIPASIFNSTALLRVAGDSGVFFDGRCALAFLCGHALSNRLINVLFQRSRVAFGV